MTIKIYTSLLHFNDSICTFKQHATGKTFSMKGSEGEPGVIPLVSIHKEQFQYHPI